MPEFTVSTASADHVVTASQYHYDEHFVTFLDNENSPIYSIRTGNVRAVAAKGAVK